MARLTVTLHPKEQDALRRLAMQERRDPRDQAAYIIRAVLETRGLLPADRPTPTTPQPTQPQPCEVTP